MQNTKKLRALSRDLAFSVCALQVGITEVHCQMRDGDMILKEKAVSGEERPLLCSTPFGSWLSNHTWVFDGHFGVVWKFAVLGTCTFFQVYVFVVQPMSSKMQACKVVFLSQNSSCCILLCHVQYSRSPTSVPLTPALKKWQVCYCN